MKPNRYVFVCRAAAAVWVSDYDYHRRPLGEPIRYPARIGAPRDRWETARDAVSAADRAAVRDVLDGHRRDHYRADGVTR